jgi:zinc and cadmium transporter
MSITNAILLACLITAVASILGGLVPLVCRVSHRWMQVLLSLVAGVMAGVAVLELIPHAAEGLLEAAGAGHGEHEHTGVGAAMLWVIVGFLAMYLLERFVCFHHHETDEGGCCHAGHGHQVSWIGAAAGLSVHAVLAGIGLGATVLLESAAAWPAAGLLLAIVLHKPFDGLAIVTLMSRDGRGLKARWTASLLYALVTPAGILIAWGIGSGGDLNAWAAPVVAITAGILLCIALSDILPELQFHTHDRLLLTAALVSGLLIAYFAASMH